MIYFKMIYQLILNKLLTQKLAKNEFINYHLIF